MLDLFYRLDATKLGIRFGGQVLAGELFLRKEGLEVAFELKGVSERDGGWQIEWYSPEFGDALQTYDLEGYDAVIGSYTMTLKPVADQEAVVVQTYGIVPVTEPYFMIPGSLYGTNNIKNAKSRQPQLNYRGDIDYPKSPVIYTRADRSTHNAVLMNAGSFVLGLRVNEDIGCGKDLYYNGLGIDTRHYDAYDRIAVTYGYHHFPVHYFGKLGPEHSHTKEQKFGYISFSKGNDYETDGHIYIARGENRYAYEPVLRYFYEQIHEHPGNDCDRLQAVRDMTQALCNDAYSHRYHYFPTVLGGGQADTGVAGDTAWTGGMQVVYPMAVASRTVAEGKPVVIDYIEHLVKDGFNEEAHMFYESKDRDSWKVSGWWHVNLKLYNRRFDRVKEAHSAYVNGQAVTYLLKTLAIAMEEQWSGCHTERWFERCRTVVDHVICQQRYDGALPVYLESDKGEGIYYNSFQGAWFLAAVAEMAKVTGDQKYFRAFDRALPFYRDFMDRVELWGMPIDTMDAVDEEGNLAYITALKTMHELTGDPELFDQLIHAFHYEFSWKFAYNTRHVNEPLKSLNWPSCGGSVTSSHNIHIHQMGNLVAEELHYVWRQTGDPYFGERLKDTLNWGLGTHNSFNGEFGFGKRGWATEQFFHSDGKQDDYRRVVDGGVWEDYLSWAAACCLLSCSLDIEDELYR